MKTIAAILMISVLLTACATTANYERMLGTWVGSSESALISRWGTPASSYDTGHNSKVLTFNRSNTFQTGGQTVMSPITTTTQGNIYGSVYGGYSGTSTTYVPTQTPVTTFNQNCTTRFTISNGYVTTWSWEGNNCRSRE